MSAQDARLLALALVREQFCKSLWALLLLSTAQLIYFDEAGKGLNVTGSRWMANICGVWGTHANQTRMTCTNYQGIERRPLLCNRGVYVQ